MNDRIDAHGHFWALGEAHLAEQIAREDAYKRREVIGVELDEEYFDIACKRIEEAQRQPDMLIEAERAAEQLDLISDKP